MRNLKVLSKQEIYDILYGCTILGTGGGGSIEEGFLMIEKCFKGGKKFILANLNELSDDDMIITPYYCGAVSPNEDTEENSEKQCMLDGDTAVKAVKIMEEYYKNKISGVVPTELGGANTAAAFYVAAMMDKYIVDGDPAGRAVPELQHSTYFTNDLPMAPIALANKIGDTAIYLNVRDDFRAEELIRSFAVASGNSVAVADHLAAGKKIKQSLIPGTLSYAYKIGKAYRKAKENNRNIAQAVAYEGKGRVIFKGKVKDYKWDTRDGFTFGEVVIDGLDKHWDSEMKIWIQNENIMSWLNKEVYVTVPDLICIINDDTKEPVTNPNYTLGMNVSIFALPAPKEWVTKKGLEVFSPRSFGFDVDFVSSFSIN